MVAQSDRVKVVAENCERCASTRIRRTEPLPSSTSPKLPWQQLGVDSFHFDGQNFLAVVDYFSQYPEVVTLKSTTCSLAISAMKGNLERFGILAIVRGDNRPQASAAEFANFSLLRLRAHHEWLTLSAVEPQVERTVRTVEGLLRKSDDPFLFPLVFGDTPGLSVFGAAQLPTAEAADQDAKATEEAETGVALNGGLPREGPGGEASASCRLQLSVRGKARVGWLPARKSGRQVRGAVPYVSGESPVPKPEQWTPSRATQGFEQEAFKHRRRPKDSVGQSSLPLD